MKTFKRSLAMLLCVLMLLSATPLTALAEEVETGAEETATPQSNAVSEPAAVSSTDVVKVTDGEGNETGYKSLQAAFDGFAPSNNTYGGTYVITLLGDTTGVNKNLQYPTSTLNVTLDLNGHTIQGDGSSIAVSINFGSKNSKNCVFTIKDSSGNNSGKITGGKGGVKLDGKDSTLNFQGGTITGNHSASKGGGILMGATAFLNMTGGVISGNSVTGSSSVNTGLGGGIFANNATISGGVVTGNFAYGGSGKQTGRGGGVCTDISRTKGYSTLTIANGTVYGNSADNAGDDIMAQGNGLSGTKYSLSIGTANWYVDGWNGKKATAGNGETARYSADAAVPYTDGGWTDQYNKSIGLKYVVTETVTEYTVTYVDGVENAEIFPDQEYTVKEGEATPAFEGTPTREGYNFIGWTPAVAETVTADATYTATWQLKGAGDICRAYLRTDKGRIYADLLNVSYNESVALELYSGEKLLTTAVLNAAEYPGPATKAELTGSICVENYKDSDTWVIAESWLPLESEVPTEIKLVVDGNVVDTHTLILNPSKTEAMTEQDWIDFPGTYAIGGKIGSVYTATNGISIDLSGVLAFTDITVKIYNGDDLLTTVSDREGALQMGIWRKYLTVSVRTTGESSSWEATPWMPCDQVIPDKIELYVDGVLCDTKTFALDAEKWAALPGTVTRPDAPDKYGNNVTTSLVQIICDTDSDHAPMTLKWQHQSTKVRDWVSGVVWSNEYNTWIVPVRIDSVSTYYVWAHFEEAYNEIRHPMVDDNQKCIDTYLKWDEEKQLWVTMDGQPIVVHVTCKTAPTAPSAFAIKSYQVKVTGIVDGEEKVYYMYVDTANAVVGEVKGSREEGFTVDVTFNIKEDDAMQSGWIAQRDPDATTDDYVYDWTKTPNSITITLNYTGGLVSNLYGDQVGDWALDNGETHGTIGEAYLIPNQPAAPEQSNVSEQLVAVICDSDGGRHETVYGKWYPQHCDTTSDIVWNTELNAWTVDVRVGGLYIMYVDQIEDANGGTEHTLVEDITTVFTTLKWDTALNKWVAVEPIELHTTCQTAPVAPSYDQVNGFQIKVKGDVDGDGEFGEPKATNNKVGEVYTTSISENGYTLSEVYGSREEGFFVDVTVNLSNGDIYQKNWIEQCNPGYYYNYDWDKTPESVTFTLVYTGDLNGTLHGDRNASSTNVDWVLSTTGKAYGVVAEAYVNQVMSNVQIVIYRNGDVNVPYKTISLGKIAKGTVMDLTELDIADYYTSANGFLFEGWYNDGKWNQYKAGQNPAGLEEITINGWTNLICMVTDYQKVVVRAVTDGDKDNAEIIFSGKALKGENLITWLNANVEVPEKTGYTLDKWYNWDWYGHKHSDSATVNGWTNVYVTYTVNTYNISVEANEGGTVEVQSTADYNELVPISITAETGYRIISAKMVYQGKNGTVTTNLMNADRFFMPAADVTIIVEFEHILYNISVESDGNGTVEVQETAYYNDLIPFTIVPNTGYKVSSAKMVYQGKNGTVTTNLMNADRFFMPAADVTIIVEFEQIIYNITVEAGEHGTVEVQSTAVFGEIVPLNITPDAGYSISVAKLLYDGKHGPVTTVINNPTRFRMPAADVILHVEFKANEYTLTLDPNGGKVDPASITVTYDAPIGELPEPTKVNNIFDGWFDVNGNEVTADTVYTVAGDSTITAKWIQYPGSSSTNVTNELFTIQCTEIHEHSWLCNWFGSHVKLVAGSVKWNEELGRWEAQAKIGSSMFSQINSTQPKKNYFGGIKHYYDETNYVIDLYYDPNFTGLNSQRKEVTGMWLPVKEYVFDVYCYTEPSMPDVSKITSNALWMRDAGNKMATHSQKYTVKKLIDGTYTLGQMYTENGKFYVKLTITDLAPYIQALGEKTGKTYVIGDWQNHLTLKDCVFTLVYTGSTTDYKQDGTGWSVDASSYANNSEKLNGKSLWLTEQFTVTYTDGVEDKEIFADQVFTVNAYTENGETKNAVTDFSATATPAFEVPEYTGYTFAGWTPEWAETVTADASYTATWTANTYTVTFNPNGGAAIDPITVTFDAKYGKLPSSALTGFSGGDSNWYLVDENGNVTDTKITKFSIVTTARDHQLFVVRKVLNPTLKITLEVPGAISNDYKYYVPGNSTRILTVTVNNMNADALDYTYAWYKNGTLIEGATEAVLTLPGNVSDSGTYKVVVTAKLKDGSTIVVTSDTASAEKEQKVQIMYAANTLRLNENYGETPATSDSYFGADTALLRTGASRVGYTFTGWNTKADGTGETYQVGDTITFPGANGNGGIVLELFAQWKANEYTVSFNTNGGPAAEPKVVTFDSKYGVLPTSPVTGLSSRKTDWYLVDENGNVTDIQIKNTTVVSVARDHTLFLKRDVLAPTLKIVLTVPGAISDDYKYYVPGNSTRVLTVTVNNMNADVLDYTYAWYKDGVLIEGATEAVLTLPGNVSDSGIYKVVVTAKLKDGTGIVVMNDTASGEKEQKVQILHAANTLYYDANGGEGGPSSNYTGGDTITVQTGEPTRIGYTFSGWNTKADGTGDAYKGGQSFTFVDDNGNGGCQVTLYAQWTANVYTITLDANTGYFETATLAETENEPVTIVTVEVTFGQPIGELPTPIKRGHTFAGWFDADGNQVTADTVYNIPGDSKLTAKWTVNTYKITWDVNEWTEVDPLELTVTFGEPIGELPIPKLTYWRFCCWKDAEGNVVTGDTIYDWDEDIVLTAIWYKRDFNAPSSPQTGDQTTMVVMSAMFLSAAGLIALILADRKRRMAK